MKLIWQGKRVEAGTSGGGGGWEGDAEQQDSEIHRWIFFDSRRPTLSVIVVFFVCVCVLRNRREELSRQEPEQTALSVAD